MTTVVQSEQLTAFVQRIFESAGAKLAFAQSVARHLVAANLKGHDSHGVGMVPAYVGNIRAGRLVVDAEARVVRDRGAVMLVDGGLGFGQVVGAQATELAIARVRETGIVCMGVRNCLPPWAASAATASSAVRPVWCPCTSSTWSATARWWHRSAAATGVCPPIHSAA